MAAGLTGRTPRYGYHLDDEAPRHAAGRRVDHTPHELHDWGALGGIVGRIAGDYWQVPALVGIDRVPTSDELKHFGAALASYGSVALFHMVGITPEAQRSPTLPIRHAVTRDDHRSGRAARSRPPIAPRGHRWMSWCSPRRSLACWNCATLADMLDGRRASVPLLVVTSPQVKPDADRLGLTARIEAAGGLVLSGMCFYQSYAREMAEANGWQTLATNSAKLVNILGGYGYRPALLSMAECVDAACSGGAIG